MTAIYLRAPDHLGDGVMALPAVALLAGHGAVTVAAPGWGPVLYRGLGVTVVPRDQARDRARGADLAVLLKPSFSAAWQARGAARRFGLPTDHRGLLLTDPVHTDALHRADRLWAVAAAALGAGGLGEGAGNEGAALPAFATDADDDAGLPGDLPDDFVLVLPGTASAETVAWRRVAALVDALGPRAVVTGGPGDEAAVTAIGGRSLPAPTLPQLARLAVRAAAVIGNDSGLPHLCGAARRAAGRPVTDVHVVYASTDPARTGPPGSTPWHGPRPDCWPCYGKHCARGEPICRDAEPGPLQAALGAA